MTLSTSLRGRLRNTTLPKTHNLSPLFEAVVNSIQSIDVARQDNPTSGRIEVEIVRSPQLALSIPNSRGERGPAPQEPILGFNVTDNGEGFHDANMTSFETLDSEYKVDYGCRGVGRLLWLKAFEKVKIKSTFLDESGSVVSRSFTFTEADGVSVPVISAADAIGTGTVVHLEGFRAQYRETSPKTAATIAIRLLEHCLWYFVRPGGAPEIVVIDDSDQIRLWSLFEDYTVSSTNSEELRLKDQKFDLVHLRVQARAGIEPKIHWCAANRVVLEERLNDKVPGLHGRLNDGDGDFVYGCYVTSTFLDDHVRSERTGFDIPDISDDSLFENEPGFSEMRTAVIGAAERYLGDLLGSAREAGRERVEKFVDEHAPRYRPILRRIDEGKLSVNPAISDRDLELFLHRQFAEIEQEIIIEGHEVLSSDLTDESGEYSARLTEYLEKVEDVKKSDLAAYVSRRRVVLDLLRQAIQANEEGKYVREHVIHKLIMPMRVTSDDVAADASNLWIIDERLAFHNYLASDKSLSSMPITGSSDRKEPDLLSLHVYDAPTLVSDSGVLPLASIVVVEIKRPMRADARDDGGPISQALNYLEKVRRGQVKTAKGRPVPGSEDIPGFCYIVADLTPSVEEQCKLMGLRRTQDKMGYFGYNDNYKAYIEVSSFDRLLNAANQRNRAFFDKLGLPIH